MDFRHDTPRVSVIVKVICEDFIIEAKVEKRYICLNSGMEELELSCGVVLRRNKDAADWRVWFSKDDIGDLKAKKCLQLDIIY